jgi:hypothetical protein
MLPGTRVVGTGSQWQDKYLASVSEYKCLSNKPVVGTVWQLFTWLLLAHLPITTALESVYSFRVLENKATPGYSDPKDRKWRRRQTHKMKSSRYVLAKCRYRSEIVTNSTVSLSETFLNLFSPLLSQYEFHIRFLLRYFLHSPSFASHMQLSNALL